MNKKIIIISTVVVAVIAIALMSYLFIFSKQRVDSRPISKNILYLTEPVHSVQGVIDAIGSDTITLSKEQKILEDSRSVKVLYTIKTTNETGIYQSMYPVPYLLSTATSPTMITPIFSDLTVGQEITVNTTEDLRILKKPIFTASSISLPEKINIISGKIKNITQNGIVLASFIPSRTAPSPTIAQSPQAIDYQVEVINDTEISRYVNNGSSSTPTKLSLSDLKKDQDIIVYTNVDVVTSTSFTALRIEPMISSPSPSSLPLPSTP